MIWTGRILTFLPLLAFLPSAALKLMRHPTAVDGFRKMGVPDAAIVPIGIVEVLCVALFVFPRTAVLGTLLTTGYLGGATMANIVNHSDFLHALAIGLLVWAATLVRVPQFRALLPLVKGDAR
jgi:hypothetical protein